MTETRYDKLDQLGKMKGLPSSPDEAELERVKNPCDENYMVRLVAPEFTSICPVTGQPDFAHLVVDYCPDEWIVESGSALVAIGIHAAVSRLMCFTAMAKRQRASGYLTKAYRLIADEVKPSVRASMLG